jgi:ABC-type Fe3+-hydroxamate transport system substrate-binding protein
MEREQIAHDLAVAKLYGSDKQTKELIDQYRKYYNEILSVLKSEPKENGKVTIMRSPF